MIRTLTEDEYFIFLGYISELTTMHLMRKQVKHMAVTDPTCNWITFLLQSLIEFEGSDDCDNEAQADWLPHGASSFFLLTQ